MNATLKQSGARRNRLERRMESTTPTAEPPAAEEQYYILASSDLPPQRDLVLKHEDTFALFDIFGDIDAKARSGEGLYYAGTRFLSYLKLKFGYGRPLLLSSTVRRDNVLLSADLTNPDVYFEGKIFQHRGTLHLYRAQFLSGQTLFQRLRLRNYSRRPTDVVLTIQFDSDYADIFEVRGNQRERRGQIRSPEVGDGEVTLSYDGLDHVRRRTLIHASIAPRATLPNSMQFRMKLGSDEERSIELTFACHSSDVNPDPCDFSDALQLATRKAERSDHLTISLATSSEQFNLFLERSRVDLNMLLTTEPQGPYPYAGVPWFATPFGRDGIITALESLWTTPAIARGVLGYLSATQAHEVSPEQDAEPGKILHEARRGEMADLGEIPFRRYYGSVDATPLYVVLAGAYYRRTGDIEFIKSIWRNIELAVQWIDRYGDSNGDGFVDYNRKSEHGLVQQGWKDSQDSIFHADGTLAEPPIALCEVQGYVYAAKIEMSAMAAALGDLEMSQRLVREAEALRRSFEERFWCENLGVYAIAIDGKGQTCQVRTSNAGQCLFSGIASPERARILAANLMGDRFHSGWGIRTVADSEPRYNPMSYHNGSVWPHDNSLIAAGFARYRFTGHAAAVLSGLFEAASYFDFDRLPELFCGFHRRAGKGPTSYPVACSPQAWSAAATFYLLQSSMGLSIDALKRRVVFVHPTLPPFLEHIRIDGLKVGGGSIDLRLFRSRDAVAVTCEHRDGDIDVIVFQ
jgi:glycogen debranching enzyme